MLPVFRLEGLPGYGAICADYLRGRIVQRRKAGKVTAAERRIRQCFISRRRAAIVNRLIEIEEEENLVLPDRTTHGATEIVVAQHRHGRIRNGRVIEVVRGCIQCVVLEVLIDCTVEGICPALTDLVEADAAYSILCREGRVVDLYF